MTESREFNFEQIAKVVFQDIPSILDGKSRMARIALDNAWNAVAEKCRQKLSEVDSGFSTDCERHVSELERLMKDFVAKALEGDRVAAEKAVQDYVQDASEFRGRRLVASWFLRVFEECVLRRKEECANQLAHEERDYARDIYRKLYSLLDGAQKEVYAKIFARYELSLDEDGVIVERPIVHPHANAGFFLGAVEVGAKSAGSLCPPPELKVKVPLFMMPDDFTVIVYDENPASYTKAENALSNLLYQMFLFKAPNISAVVLDANDHVRSFGGMLLDDAEFSGFVRVERDMLSFKRHVEEMTAELPRNFTEALRHAGEGTPPKEVFVIAVWPSNVDEYGVRDLAGWIRSTASFISRGVRFVCVVGKNFYAKVIAANPVSADIAKTAVLNLDGGDKPPTSLAALPVKVVGMDFSFLWNRDSANEKVRTLKALLNPPQKRRETSIYIPLAKEKTGGFRYVRYDVENASTMFIEAPPRTGKSYLLLNYISMACDRYTSDQLNFVIVDLKDGSLVNEARALLELPHLRCLVAADGAIAQGLLSDILGEMHERYRLFDKASERNGYEGCNGLDDYTLLRQKGTLPKDEFPCLPRVVVVVDECGNLFDDRAAQPVLEELLRKGGAAGFQFIFTCQDDKRNDFAKALFNIHVLMERNASTGIRTLRVAYGGETARDDGLDELVPITMAEGQLGISNISRIAKASEACEIKNKAVVFKPGVLPEVRDFPVFDIDVAKEFQKTTANSLVFPIGIDLRHLTQLKSLDIKAKGSPHLAVFGNCDGRGYKAFVTTFFKALAFWRTRFNIRVDAFDYNGTLANIMSDDVKDIVNVFGNDEDFAHAVYSWAQKAMTGAQPNQWHFLIVADAHDYFKDEIGRHKASYSLVSSKDSATTSSVPAVEESMLTDKSMEEKVKDADKDPTAFFGCMIGGMGDGARGVDAEKMGEDDGLDAEHFVPVDAIKNVIRDAGRNKAILILLSDRPLQTCNGFSPDGSISLRYVIFKTSQKSRFHQEKTDLVGYVTDSVESSEDYENLPRFVPFNDFKLPRKLLA